MDKVRTDCPALPKGWIREVVFRKSGVSAGRADIYYYSPDGKKFRSKTQIAQYLGEGVDLSSFDFRTGCLSESSKTKKRRLKPDFNFGKDFHGMSTVSPKRKLIRNSIDREVKVVRREDIMRVTTAPPPIDDRKYTGRRGELSSKRLMAKMEAEMEAKRRKFNENSAPDGPKPRQLFWMKRLQGIKSVDQETLKANDHMKLPENIRPVGPGLDGPSLVNSIMTFLHTNGNNGKRMIAQNMSLSAFRKNPSVWCNPDQPFCPPFVVTMEMIKEQEKRVEAARRNLTEAIELLNMYEDEEEESDLPLDDE